MAIEMNDLLQLSPVYISVFMLLTSLFNGDVKALIWLSCIIVGIVLLIPLSTIFERVGPCHQPPAIDIFGNYPNLSVSTFLIIFTLFYLILPMQSNNDWNYYVITGFLGMFVMDTLFKVSYLCTTKLGILSGAVIGAMFSYVCYSIIHVAGGDKLLYFNVISSNNVYCSRPKKQQFKCYVYKNGEIISTL